IVAISLFERIRRITEKLADGVSPSSSWHYHPVHTHVVITFGAGTMAIPWKRSCQEFSWSTHEWANTTVIARFVSLRCEDTNHGETSDCWRHRQDQTRIRAIVVVILAATLAPTVVFIHGNVAFFPSQCR
ncbi:hypothetical protein PIB30_088298, partial [Stylosanthes scabra]|nr:hypothetical protein [Stylosanthes scabra]